jgi:hypothetical protein
MLRGLVRWQILHLELHMDLATVSELDGVGQQVGQDLHR